jgi:hypothetical protein
MLDTKPSKDAAEAEGNRLQMKSEIFKLRASLDGLADGMSVSRRIPFGVLAHFDFWLETLVG